MTNGASTVQPASVPATPEAAVAGPMELWISHSLRIGVLIAAVIIGAGVLLFFTRGAGPDGPNSFHELTANGGHTVPVSPASIARGVRHADASAVIGLGVLALILTPIVRVAMTAGLFAAQRDRPFVLITVAVLALLLLGLVGVGK